MEDKQFHTSTILTEDAALTADFIKTRLKSVQDDIQLLADQKISEQGPWAECFERMVKIYGRQSDEPFKWYKYYFREHIIPETVALPVLIQIYFTSAVDQGFVNALAKAALCEPEKQKAERIETMKKELNQYLDDQGSLLLYRGAFSHPFGVKKDESRPIERAVNFTLEEATACHYATCWFPEKAVLYKVSVPLEDVLWCNPYSEDTAAVVKPLSKGGKWHILEETQLSREDYQTKVDERTALRAYEEAFGR